MKGSLQIAKFAGIPVKIHWTFGLLVLWISYLAAAHGLGIGGIVLSVLIMLAIFLCVVLHEYGHALTAKKYGVTTRDIILSPIGGIARLEKLPEIPRHEFFIAIAGPLVNVAIILILIAFHLAFGGTFPDIFSPRFWSFADEQSIVLILLKINMILVGFNMIPAFPMDGGRVVRSLLTGRFGRTRATRIASLMGQVLAAGFFIAGLMTGDIILSVIGVFVFFAAFSEYRAALMSASLEKLTVRDIVRHLYTRLYTFDSMQRALQATMHGLEESFLVFTPDNQILAILHKTQITDAVAKGQLNDNIALHMSTHFQIVDIDMSVKDVFNLFREQHFVIVPVFENGELIGVIDQGSLNKALEISRKPLAGKLRSTAVDSRPTQ